MNTNIITRAQAQSLPSVIQLKDEAKAKRLESAGNGKKMGHNVALKEVARKYGFKTWEALEASARSSGAALPTQSVVLYTLNGFDQFLIVNRKLVASSRIALGEADLEDVAFNMADALGVELCRDGIMSDDNYDEYGGYRDTNEMLIGEDLIDAPQPSTSTEYVTAADSVDALAKTFNGIVEKARTVPGYHRERAPYVVFEVTAASAPNPDPTKGSIECVVEVFVEAYGEKAPKAFYSFYTITEADGRLEEFPLQYGDKAYEAAVKILKDLNDVGIVVSPGDLTCFDKNPK